MSSVRSFPSSPRSQALPSPPTSPLLAASTPADSIPPSPASSMSSFPSLTSSFFDLSAAPSPPYLPLSSHEHPESSSTLIIPSLILPEPRQQSTTHGDVLGNLSILVVGRHGAGKSVLASMLVDGNEDIVDPPRWSDNVLSASTTWSDGLHSGNNVKIVEMPGFDEEDGDFESIIGPILEVIQEPFRRLSPLLNPNLTTPLIPLITSPHTPLHTALILLLSSPPTPIELSLLSSLCPHIPVIPLPTFPTLTRGPSSRISSFRPLNSLQLRTGLFRSPRTIFTLRREAAERFLRWRQAEFGARVVDVESPFKQSAGSAIESMQRFDWDLELSRDVAESRKEMSGDHLDDEKHESLSDVDDVPRHALDPLHLSSIIVLSLSLLKPLRERVWAIFIGPPVSKPPSRRFSRIWNLGLVFTMGVCAGLGLGFLLGTA